MIHEDRRKGQEEKFILCVSSCVFVDHVSKFYIPHASSKRCIISAYALRIKQTLSSDRKIGLTQQLQV
jgi:hypothetical protein